MTDDDSLEILRQRATCPICFQIFSLPKKLTNCCHVFCLKCIKQHMQSRLPNNFPPCPVCRTAITKPLKDIDSLEPARAEEDIVTVVKKYEMCGICNKNENPKIHCLECSRHICENCKLCHSHYYPHHNVVSILVGTVNKELFTRRMCDRHDTQVLDLFCVMCYEVLCSYCRDQSHGICTGKYSDSVVLDRYNRGFLRAFLEDSKERIALFKRKTLPRFVYIKEVELVFKKWWDNINKELQQSIEFLNKYQSQIDSIVDGNPEDSEIPARIRQKIRNDVSSVLKCCKDTQTRILERLETATGFETAKFVLRERLDQTCRDCLFCRSLYLIETRPLKLIMEASESGRTNLKQMLCCPLLMFKNTFFGMIGLGYREEEMEIHEKRIIDFSEQTKTSMPACSVLVFIQEASGPVDLCQTYSELLNYKEFEFRQSHELYKGIMKPVRRHIDILSEERLLLHLNIIEITTGYISDLNCTGMCILLGVRKYESPIPSIYLELFHGSGYPSTYITDFVNAIILPVKYNIDGVCKSSNDDLACMIGNRNLGSGLETLFIYSNYNENKTHGVFVNTSVAEFKFGPGIRLSEQNECYLIKDQRRAFSILMTDPTLVSLALSYHSIRTDSCAPEMRLKYFDKNTKTETVVPVSTIQVDLLCSARQSCYFVRRTDANEEIIIGKLVLSNNSINSDTILSVKQGHIIIPIEKLKPLRLIEYEESGIVVVCAVEDDNKTFVTIWTNKPEAEAVEVLELQYAMSEISEASVFDVGINLNGTFCVVLEDKDGKHYCGATRFYRP